jgi:hypothetical protein
MAVTAEAAGSSPVVPAISNQALTEMAPFRRGHKKVPKRHKLKAGNRVHYASDPHFRIVTLEASGFSGRRSRAGCRVTPTARIHAASDSWTGGANFNAPPNPVLPYFIISTGPGQFETYGGYDQSIVAPGSEFRLPGSTTSAKFTFNVSADKVSQPIYYYVPN